MIRLRLSFLFMALVAGQAADSFPLAFVPNDTYWNQQWYLDNVDAHGVRLGVDMNARDAWAHTLGQGVTIAIVDDGVDLNHPDLVNQGKPEFHWNFASDTANGAHPTHGDSHGTPVAGLAIAEGNNNLGISGMAPAARFASWVIYKTNETLVSTNQLANMFRFHSDQVQVQNHSWIKPTGLALTPMSPAEDAAIADATKNGRQGRGVVMIRAAGNDRLVGRNANDDAYISDARVVAVAALQPDGVVAGYSNPGASILVAAPGGEQGFGSLFTTDRVGSKEGLNQIGFTNDLADYVFDSLGFTGTSASTPLISGTVALMLSENPALTVRDVQQILLLSATQPNPNDPDVQTNSAGLRVGHNAGFGLLNAGTAVSLAARWTNRPAATSSQTTVEQELPLADGGLSLAVEPVGGGSPNLLITALPGLGIHVDQNTAKIPLIYVGDAAQPLAVDLSGKAALIRRGNASFSDKITHAAQAGALFAVVFNNEGTNQLQVMGSTDYVPVPAIFISQQDGETLTNILGQNSANAGIVFDTAQYTFNVADSLLCEHVKVTLNATHEQRGDLRVTLVSPSGTRSILQRLGPDLSPFPGQWTFMSTHHFFESSQGPWQLFMGDEAAGGIGSVQSATLEILGVPIKDSDHDGLDDDWEIAHFGTLKYTARDDPDRDGYSNALEQILGTDPAANETKFALTFSLWNDSAVRLSWPSRSGVLYQVLDGTNVTSPLSVLDEVTGGFPQTQSFRPRDGQFRFFLVREKP